jgi:hypothetical protein
VGVFDATENAAFLANRKAGVFPGSGFDARLRHANICAKTP